MSTLFYIASAVLTVCFCNGFFFLFHLYSRTKEYSSQSYRNDDFLLQCLGMTVQLKSLLFAFFLYFILSSTPHQVITCIFFVLWGVTFHIQVVSLFLISLTRFLQLFFPKTFGNANHFLIGYIIKLTIILFPTYIQFMLMHTCGMDVLCPRDMRKLLGAMSFSNASEYHRDLFSWLLETHNCRKEVMSFIAPILLALILLPNLCICIQSIAKIFRCVALPSFITPSPPTLPDIELRTISASVEPPTDAPEATTVTQTYSVGQLPIIIMSIHHVSILFTIHYNPNVLNFIMLELSISIIQPLVWAASNTDIITCGIRNIFH